MLDYRNVYIKEQTDYRGKGRRIKLGITKNMTRRQAEVSSGLPGSWGEVGHRRLFFAHQTEQALHRRLRRYHTPIRNVKPGAGGSEIFTVPGHILALLRLTLGALSAADYVISFTAVAIAGKIIFALCYLLY